MNKRLRVLVKGELIRLNKYNVFSISVLIAIIWGIILFLIDESMLASFLPLLLVTDATMMSVMYIGSVMYFEKTESTISTMLVTPTSNNELVLSKVLANTLHNMFSSALIIIVFIFVKQVEVNIILVFIGIISATTFFTIAGLCMAYFQKDFTDMLVNIMIISFALFIPTALYMFGVLKADFWEYVLLINPVQASFEVIGAAFEEDPYTVNYFISLTYMLLGSFALYKFFAIPKFQDYAVKQSGV